MRAVPANKVLSVDMLTTGAGAAIYICVILKNQVSQFPTGRPRIPKHWPLQNHAKIAMTSFTIVVNGTVMDEEQLEETQGAFVEYLVPMEKGVGVVSRPGIRGARKYSQWLHEMECADLPDSMFMRPVILELVMKSGGRHVAYYDQRGLDVFDCCVMIREKHVRAAFARALLSFMLRAAEVAFAAGHAYAVADMKPENILYFGSDVNQGGFDATQFKIIDWGIVDSMPGLTIMYSHPFRSVTGVPTKRDAAFTCIVIFMAVYMNTSPPDNHATDIWGRRLAMWNMFADGVVKEAYNAYEHLRTLTKDIESMSVEI
jgi:hypothetical protein